MRAGIALGSNVGDRMRNLREAREALITHQPAPTAVKSSGIYETEPVNCDPGTPPYLNAVVEMECEGHPLQLLAVLHTIEEKMGRPSKHPRNAPRTIDLDILYFGNLALSSDEVVIPHPRMHARRFVLLPLADIRPELVLPGRNETISELLADLPDKPTVKLFSRTF